MKVTKIIFTEDRLYAADFVCEACDDLETKAVYRVTGNEVGETHLCKSCLVENLGKKDAEKVLKDLGKKSCDIYLKRESFEE